MPLNVILFIVTLVGGPATFFMLTGLVFLLALPTAMFAKSIAVKSAAASALAGALVVWVGELVYSYATMR